MKKIGSPTIFESVTDPEPESDASKRSRAGSPTSKKPRQNVTLRIRTELREKLEQRARLNGRSLSEEIEMFIELGFSDQENKDELWSKDIRRHFEKDIEALFEERKNNIINDLHDKNMNEMRKMFVVLMDRMRDMQTLVSNEKIISDEARKILSSNDTDAK